MTEENGPGAAPPKKFATTDELCVLAGVGRAAIYEWLREGLLPEPETHSGRGNISKWPMISLEIVKFVRSQRELRFGLPEIRPRMVKAFGPKILCVLAKPLGPRARARPGKILVNRRSKAVALAKEPVHWRMRTPVEHLPAEEDKPPSKKNPPAKERPSPKTRDKKSLQRRLAQLRSQAGVVRGADVTTPLLLEILCVARATLYRWIAWGILLPPEGHPEKQRHGGRARWPIGAVERAEQVRALLDEGQTLDSIRRRLNA